MGMRVYVEGRGPIALEAIRLLEAAQHEIVDRFQDADTIVWCRGNSYEQCVTKMLDAIKSNKHRDWVVVTSEHGSLPIMDGGYAEYQAIKAAQKMLCRCMVEWGMSCIDISPAFVIDSSPEKRLNKDPYYKHDVEAACNDTFPVTCNDVAKAIVFAVENCGTMSGSEIKVSAGWTQGRI